MKVKQRRQLSRLLHVICTLSLFFLVRTTYAQKDLDLTYINTVRDSAGHIPSGYVPPLISNGSLNMLIDFEGCQEQKKYVGMTPGVFWAGRRPAAAKGELLSFGYFGQELKIDGRNYKNPSKWSQTLDTKNAVVYCSNEYGAGLTIETTAFTYLPSNLIVIKKKFTNTSSRGQAVDYAFKYQFSPGNTLKSTTEKAGKDYWLKRDANCVELQYETGEAQGLKGIISLFSDKDFGTVHHKESVVLTAKVDLKRNQSSEITYYILFEDNMDGQDFLQRAMKLQSFVGQIGFDKLLVSHKKQWNDYQSESYVRLPNIKLEKVYNTAQYHLRANATRWSFPVGIFPTHWAGRYFGWDEMFCFQALASSNHLSISKRVPEFRHAGLKIANKRVSHYGDPVKYGARYPWESLEDGSDATPPGFWNDHVFHMSNIALSSWLQYLYSGDDQYLKDVGYPVIRECARFYTSHMIYEDANGSMFIGKCTDLERLGPAKQNPFMTASGAIYTLEAAAKASKTLKVDNEEAAIWQRTAAKLRENLPNDKEKYIPYPGATEKSVASLGGLFPYPVFGKESRLQRNAAYDFFENANAAGNMYPVGTGISAWYAGWIASALALLGDRNEPEKLLSTAAIGAGRFSELFEINEPKVSMHPWFSTASGNYIYALNQILLQCTGDEILIAPAVPRNWEQFDFKLAGYDNLVVKVSVKGSKIVKLTILPGDHNKVSKKTIILPAYLVDSSKFNKDVVIKERIHQENYHLAIQIKGATDVIRL